MTGTCPGVRKEQSVAGPSATAPRSNVEGATVGMEEIPRQASTQLGVRTAPSSVTVGLLFLRGDLVFRLRIRTLLIQAGIATFLLREDSGDGR